MSELAIRSFVERDRGSVVDLWRRCDLVRASNDPDRDIDRKVGYADGGFLVAVRGASVVGTVLAGYDGHRGWINYLAVDPGERGAQLGSRLMDAAEGHLRGLGCAKVNLQIRQGNSGVRAFYEVAGYAEDDVISMGKRLASDTAD